MFSGTAAIILLWRLHTMTHRIEKAEESKKHD
jgi:hypothetical protein